MFQRNFSVQSSDKLYYSIYTSMVCMKEDFVHGRVKNAFDVVVESIMNLFCSKHEIEL